MDPVVGGAIILGGASLLQGIMGGFAANRKIKSDLYSKATEQEMEGSMKSANTMVTGEQNAFSQLMDTYKHSLL